MCMGDSVAVCDETGQSFQQTPCTGGMRCVGAGNCVECAESTDCDDLTEGCKVGMCTRNACAAANAPNNTECSASGGRPGRCSGGTCMCEPQCQGKRCGDNGCSGSCGTCSGGTKCSADFQCVECTTNSDCTSTNPCSRGTCSGERCSFQDLNGTRCELTGSCVDGDCCHANCAGKCAGDDDGCGNRCPNPCQANEQCSSGRCTPSTVCPPNSFGCGDSEPECWDCRRQITSGTITVFRCNSSGSAWTIVDYCGVADCTAETETATCQNNGTCTYVPMMCNP